MKQFLSKIIAFLFLLLVFPIIFIIFFETNSDIRSKMQSSYLNGYNLILEDIKNTQEKKIVFVGGSNVGLGLDSKRIEDSLGVKTFNFGVNGGVGIKKPIEDISKYLNSSDIVILSPEYSNFDLNNYDEAKYIVQFLNNFGPLKINSFESFKYYLKHIKYIYLAYIGNKIRYNVNWFNKNGDVIGHLGLESLPINTDFGEFNINENDLKNLKRFIDYKLKAKDFYFIPPVTHEFRFSDKKENNLNQSLLEIFKDKYPLSIKSLTFENKYFFDSGYHLNYDGRKKRTEIIIEFLEKAVNQEK